MPDINESPATDQRRIGGVPVRPKTVFLAVITILAVWFIVINTGSVKIHLYFSAIMAPLWIVLAATALGGVLIGWFGTHRAARGRRRHGA